MAPSTKKIINIKMSDGSIINIYPARKKNYQEVITAMQKKDIYHIFMIESTKTVINLHNVIYAEFTSYNEEELR